MAEIFLDTSGDGLHKRGYRRNSTLAPLKETLAAAMLDLGRVYPDSTVQDPFCGSGTMCIEAGDEGHAHRTGSAPPGFAAEHYAFVPKEAFTQAREKALSEIVRDAPFEAFGSDIDPAAVELATHNAKLAGVGSKCRFSVAGRAEITPSGRSLVFTNPPYGRAPPAAFEEAAELARVLGKRLEESPVRGAYIITADAEFESHFGRRAKRAASCTTA